MPHSVTVRRIIPVHGSKHLCNVSCIDGIAKLFQPKPSFEVENVVCCYRLYPSISNILWVAARSVTTKTFHRGGNVHCIKAGAVLPFENIVIRSRCKDV